jgi:hypothetical protein
MNRKIIAIFALILVALSVCVVSAADSDTSGDDAGEVTIDGIKFNIPDGFKEDKDLSVDGEVNESAGLQYTTWGKVYSNDDNDLFFIDVATYDGVEVTDEMPKLLGGDPQTINGVDGYDYNSEPFDGFVFAKDGKLVIIIITDGNLLKDIVIK